MNFERQKTIAENRAKALRRIKERQRQIRNYVRPTPSVKPKSTVSKPKTSGSSDIAMKLTPEQRIIIERNRQRSRRRHQESNPTTSVPSSTSNQHPRNTAPSNPNNSQIDKNSGDILDQVRFSHHSESSKHTEISPRKRGQYIRPSIKKSDYIEYDFSTMKDTFGGFLSEDTDGQNADGQKEKTLEDWKKEQEEKEALNPLGPAPPPLDIANAPTCYECGSIDVDKKLLETFKCRVCRKCEEKMPEKYSLLTKTECKEDYFLTEPELADLSLFHRIVKENPHSGTFSKMQLFLRYQIEEYAFKKWGGSENLDKEWLRREGMRKARKEKKFKTKLYTMRRKLRAEELTRKFKDAKGIKHKHDWSAPVKVTGDNPNLYKRRCMECGMEVEEIIM